MAESLPEWHRQSSASVDSIVISDSDLEIVDSSTKDHIYVIESSEGSEKSTGISAKAIRRRIKQYVPSDSDEDNDSEGASSIEDDVKKVNDKRVRSTDSSFDSDSHDFGNERFRSVLTKHSRQKVNRENRKIARILISSDNSIEGSDCEMHEDAKDQNSNISVHSERVGNDVKPEIALSLAKKEIGVGNIDPLVAQKRALLICKMEHLQNSLSKTKLLLSNGNIELLPDKGEKLWESIKMQEKEIEEISIELENTPLVQGIKAAPYSSKEDISESNEEYFPPFELFTKNLDSSYTSNDILMQPPGSTGGKDLGKKAQETLNKELSLTVDRLQDLHGSLTSRPSEDERAPDPQGLKVKLMPHQQHALAWLLWREQQRPSGGVLADDMGLGKTLTMISLIIATATMNLDDTDGSDDDWNEHRKPIRHKGGTLVVCPASLLAQWEGEITNRCKRGMVSVVVYHGANRESVPKRLAKNDVVITTYNILTREFKTMSTVYKVHWKRVILDEAHIIRNHKSQMSEAVCGLFASKRWALTGTPIQNKEMDLYSILKFLKCSPFDDLRVWKRWVDNKNAAGCQRLATVMKTLMLRRTKQELQAKGELESLPEKFIEEVLVSLDRQEQLVYEKVLIFSRTLFAQFLAQRAEKDHMYDLASGKFDKPTFLSNPNKNTQFTKAQNRLLSQHADVKTHEILVLLLRLRQICVHPSLIHAMLDDEDMKETGIMDSENLDPNLLSQLDNINLGEDENADAQEIGVDNRVTENLLTAQNPVFDSDRLSTKLKMVFNTVQEILKKGDKLIIVSQWTSMLDIVGIHLANIEGATFSKFTGQVPIKDRQGIMDEFNAPNTDPKILLLSLTAGGVGLNLVGANHLLLIDIHWNPQLETQAQDRIYRFGQRKDVHIYKFICKDTIEERIKHLQERKLEIAKNVLSGGIMSNAAKLTLNDLKSLFAL